MTSQIARSEFRELIVEIPKNPVIVTAARLSSPGPYIVCVNHAFTPMTGQGADQVTGQTPRILQSPLTDRAEVARMEI